MTVAVSQHHEPNWNCCCSCVTCTLGIGYFVCQAHIVAHLPKSTADALQDRSVMYTWGSVFYAIYFWISFPMFFSMDEKPRRIWSVGQAATDSLAASMAVTILLDLWRIAFTGSETSSLPWLQ